MTKSKTKSRTSAKARAEKKRQSTNIFEELPMEASGDEDVSDPEAAAEILKIPGS